MLRRLYDWTMEKAAHPHAVGWLAAFAFVEASFFPIPPHPLLGTASLHASIISGGRELSSYPESCRLQMERRTVSGESEDQAGQEVRDIIDDLGRQRVPPRAAFAGASMELRVNGSIQPEKLAAFLESHGYGRAGTVMEPGEYAMRGGIIDLFPARADLRRYAGMRIERLGSAFAPIAVDTYGKAVEQRPDHLTGGRPYAYSLVRAGRLTEAIAMPWVVLSNGVRPERFDDAAVAAARGGASGFLAGRAIWLESIAAEDPRTDLETVAAARLAALAERIDGVARPWSAA